MNAMPRILAATPHTAMRRCVSFSEPTACGARLFAPARLAVLLVACMLPAVVAAQNFPVTPQQRATANQVAQAGVALSDLSPDAPERHTVVRGDTLWAISGLFLRSPWRWPELWGM